MKRILTLIISAILITAAISVSFASSEDTGKTDEPIRFEITPADEEWKTMGIIDRRQSCYISAEDAERLTTPALLETVLEYPFFCDMVAFNSIAEGIRITCERFPALAVLLGREDVQECIENRYVDTQNGRDIDAVMLNEYLLILKYGSEIDLSSPAISGEHARAVVHTPNGTPVQVVADLTWAQWIAYTGYPGNMNDAIAAQYSVEYEQSYPSATIIRASSPKYNCHSYAWYITSPTNRYWMNDPSSYVTDGSYTLGLPVRNARVTYQEGGIYKHSAIIASDATSVAVAAVKSKWGALALFSHTATDCPYFPAVLKCWEM